MCVCVCVYVRCVCLDVGSETKRSPGLLIAAAAVWVRSKDSHGRSGINCLSMAVAGHVAERDARQFLQRTVSIWFGCNIRNSDEVDAIS